MNSNEPFIVEHFTLSFHYANMKENNPHLYAMTIISHLTTYSWQAILALQELGEFTGLAADVETSAKRWKVGRKILLCSFLLSPAEIILDICIYSEIIQSSLF